jgi:hypothetical protein
MAFSLSGGGPRGPRDHPRRGAKGSCGTRPCVSGPASRLASTTPATGAVASARRSSRPHGVSSLGVDVEVIKC